MIQLLSLLLCSQAWAEDSWQLDGYVSPAFAATLRPNAVPQDQFDFGMTDSRVGLSFHGAPLEHWSFKAYLLVGVDTIQAITAAEPVDSDNNGSMDSIATSTSAAMADIVRETSVSFEPAESFDIRLGRMPIPFTSQAQSPDTMLLFPSRAGPNSVFVADDDLGGLAELNLDGVFLGSVGLFNGTGTGVSSSEDLGVLYMARVDINPLGSFGFDESRPSGPFRLGLGAGAIFHPYTSYDSAGYKDVVFTDIRCSLSLRLAVAGLSTGAELLRRFQQDSLTSRPVEATGAFGWAGWYLPMGLEPMLRLGWVVEDQSFAPLQTRWAEAGVNIYPRHADETRAESVKFTLQYNGEYRITERDIAHGIGSQLQLLW